MALPVKLPTTIHAGDGGLLAWGEEVGTRLNTAAVGTVLDPVRAKLLGREDVVLAVATDSTGWEAAAWFYRLAQTLQAQHPEYSLISRWWDDATSTLDQVTQVVGVERLTIAADAFNRAAGELVGTPQPRGGANWAGNTGGWSLTGDGAIRPAGGGDPVLGPGITVTSTVWEAHGTVTIDTTPSGGYHAIFTGGYVQGSEASIRRLSVGFRTEPDGTLQFDVEIQDPAWSAVVGWTTLTGHTPGDVVTLDWLLHVDGTSVTATAGGQTITGTLTSGQATAVQANGIYIIGLTAPATWRVSDITLDVIQPLATPPTLTVIVGGKPGTTLAYQQARLAAMFPGTVDHIHVSNGHNYDDGTVPDFLTAYDGFVAAFLAAHPESALTCVMQNPQFPGKDTAAAHRARQVALRDYAREHAYGILDVLTVFETFPDWTGTLIRQDQVHPTAADSFDDTTDPANGQFQWMTAALAQFT